MKIFLIFLGVIIMGKFLATIKNYLNFVKKLDTESGKLRKKFLN